MITTFLNVNIQYVLHFLSNKLVSYSPCRHHLLPLEKKRKSKSGTDERQQMSVRQRPAGGAAERGSLAFNGT